MEVSKVRGKISAGAQQFNDWFAAGSVYLFYPTAASWLGGADVGGPTHPWRPGL